LLKGYWYGIFTVVCCEVSDLSKLTTSQPFQIGNQEQLVVNYFTQIQWNIPPRSISKLTLNKLCHQVLRLTCRFLGLRPLHSIIWTLSGETNWQFNVWNWFDYYLVPLQDPLAILISKLPYQIWFLISVQMEIAHLSSAPDMSICSKAPRCVKITVVSSDDTGS